jgi:uncharacterized protein with HEPN domain
MSCDATERLQDIQQALGSSRTYVGGSLAEPKIADALVLHAVLFNLIVIGEAAKSIGDELRAEAPDVPWSDYAGLRDVIAHQYFRVQTQIIENTVRRDLPRLAQAIERLLPTLGSSDAAGDMTGVRSAQRATGRCRVGPPLRGYGRERMAPARSRGSAPSQVRRRRRRSQSCVVSSSARRQAAVWRLLRRSPEPFDAARSRGTDFEPSRWR